MGVKLGDKNQGKILVSEDLLKVRNLIGAPRKIRVRDNREEVLTQLKELGYKIETIEKNKKRNKKSITPKRKKQILFILKDKKLTSRKVGKILGMSRSRANEYLKFMEEEGILVGEKKGRKKYYTIKLVTK